MKVLWFSNGILSKDSSKGSGSWLHAMRDLLSPEIELVNITKGTSNVIERHNGNGITEYILPSWKLKNGVPSADNINRIEEIINVEKPDLIHIWGVEQYWALLFSRGFITYNNVLLEIQGVVSSCVSVFWGGLTQYKIKKCKSFREVFFSRKEGSLQWYYRDFLKGGKREKEIIGTFRTIATQSDWTRDQILPYLNKKTLVLRSLRPLREAFISSNKWNQCDKRSLKIFTSTSYYLPFKGIHILLEAIAILKTKYPEIILEIAGPNLNAIPWYKQNGYQHLLLKMIDDLGIKNNISFCGRLDAKGLIDKLLNSYVFVNPSFVESYSASMAEALCLGVPCVCSYAGAMPEFSKSNGVALYYSPCDYCSCAAKILSIITDKGRAISLSRNAIERMEELCNPKAVLNRQLDTYQSVQNNEFD